MKFSTITEGIAIHVLSFFRIVNFTRSGTISIYPSDFCRFYRLLTKFSTSKQYWSTRNVSFGLKKLRTYIGHRLHVFLWEHRKILKPLDVLSFLGFKPKNVLKMFLTSPFSAFFVPIPNKMRILESTKPKNVLKMFLIFWVSKPCVLIYFVLIKKTCNTFAKFWPCSANGCWEKLCKSRPLKTSIFPSNGVTKETWVRLMVGIVTF